MKKKIVGIFVCTLLIGTVFTVSGTVSTEGIYILNPSGNTLYVGGSGPGNYTSIQDAIDDAEDSDTIYVYDDSSPYYENIIVDKPLILVGEDRETTIIDGNKIGGHVVNITSDNVDFSGFTVQNCGHFAGIMVISSKNNIHDCKIMFNQRGIQLQAGLGNDFPIKRGNIIANNIFENNSDTGLIVYGNKKCQIIGNKALNNRNGIALLGFGRSIIEGNILVNNDVFGLEIFSKLNRVLNNEFRNNKIGGLRIWQANFNFITQNNFIYNGENNTQHATFFWSFWQRWNNNYWNPRENLPSNSTKPYFIYRGEPTYTPVPFNVDWHPAAEPYDIGV